MSTVDTVILVSVLFAFSIVMFFYGWSIRGALDSINEHIREDSRQRNISRQSRISANSFVF